MRKSIILFSVLAIYIWGSANLWGCSGSEDKYDLINKDDRKAIKTICNCMEPMTKVINNMMNEPDSSKKLLYEDSLKLKAMELTPCMEKIEGLEANFGTSKEYVEQFISYIQDKHPDCLALFLGTKVSGKSPIDSLEQKKDK